MSVCQSVRMNAVISVDLAMSVCPYARCDLGNYNMNAVISDTLNAAILPTRLSKIRNWDFRFKFRSFARIASLLREYAMLSNAHNFHARRNILA